MSGPRRYPELTRRSAMIASAVSLGAGAALATPASGSVVELRQYKIVPGRRDAMIALFDRAFVESQEALGMRLVGQFRALDDPDRFVWIREFRDMADRARALEAFYSGPIWQSHRGEANPMLDDNDNVLLLRPAAPGAGFAPSPPRTSPPGPAGLVAVHVWHLWKEPDAALAEAFRTVLRPELEAAGLTVLAAHLPERAANNFPRLPVREGEKVFVWFTWVPTPQTHDEAMARLEKRPAWSAFVAERLERQPQVLRLAPTPRSALR